MSMFFQSSPPKMLRPGIRDRSADQPLDLSPLMPTPAAKGANGAYVGMKTPAEVMSGKVGVQTQPPQQTTQHEGTDLPEWAHAQIMQGGGAPANFRMSGGHLVSARTPEQITADITAHPPITTQRNAGEGFRSVPPQAPAQSPMTQVATPGTAAAAPPAQADGMLDSMNRQYRNALASVNVGDMDPNAIAARRAHAMQIGGMIGQHQLGQSQIAQGEPGHQAKMLGAIASDPGALTALGASRGQSPAEAQAYGDIAVGIRPEARAAASNPGIGLRDQIGSAAGIKGPGQAVLAHEVQRHINNMTPQEFKDQAMVDAPASHFPYHGPFPDLLGGIASHWAAGMNSMFGGAQKQGIYDPVIQQHMKALSLQAPPGTVNFGIPPQ